jgi:hypothetical protein
MKNAFMLLHEGIQNKYGSYLLSRPAYRGMVQGTGRKRHK